MDPNTDFFRVDVQEWNYFDQWHSSERVSWMVLEAGRYITEDRDGKGGEYEVGHAMLSDGPFQDSVQI